MEFSEWLEQAKNKQLVVSLNMVDSPAVMCYRFYRGTWGVKRRHAIIEISDGDGSKVCIPMLCVARKIDSDLIDGYKVGTSRIEFTLISV